MAEKHPYRTWRTGTEAFTIIEAHPYHKAVKWWIAGTKKRSIWTSGGIRARTYGFAQQENLRPI
jgi:hypothetical protein